MKNLLVTLFAFASLTYAHAAEKETIRISTDNTDLVLQVGENGRLYQTYLGEKLLHQQVCRTSVGIYMPGRTVV